MIKLQDRELSLADLMVDRSPLKQGTDGKKQLVGAVILIIFGIYEWKFKVDGVVYHDLISGDTSIFNTRMNGILANNIADVALPLGLPESSLQALVSDI